MTVLVAAKNEDTTILASDRQVTYWQHSGTLSKQFDKRKITFAGCGTVRTLQVVKHLLNLRPRTEDDSEEGYVFGIAQDMKALLDKEGALETMKNGQKKMDSSFLLVGLEKLYNISPWFCIQSEDTFISDGCGAEIAMGAFHVQSEDVPLKERVEKSIEVANTLSLFCGNGVDIKEL
jgi:ATP-dependent protease HslVU (ClpYQ) peptidase subunit